MKKLLIKWKLDNLIDTFKDVQWSMVWTLFFIKKELDKQDETSSKIIRISRETSSISYLAGKRIAFSMFQKLLQKKPIVYMFYIIFAIPQIINFCNHKCMSK